MLHDSAAAEAAALRVAVLQGHLQQHQQQHQGAASSAASTAFHGPVAIAAGAVASPDYDGGEDPSLVQYSIALPERLNSPGPWAVRRYERWREEGKREREKENEWAMFSCSSSSHQNSAPI